MSIRLFKLRLRALEPQRTLIRTRHFSSVVRPLFVQQHTYDSLHRRNSRLLVQILVAEHAPEEPVKERSHHH